MLVFIGIAAVLRIAQQREHLALELLVGRLGADQRHALVAVHQIARLLVLARRVGRELEQHVAVHPLDIGQRRHHGNLFLLGEADHRIQPLLVDGADDQVGFPEGVAFDDFADARRVAGRVVEVHVHRTSVFELHAVQPQQKTLIELQVVAVRLAARGEGQQQRHVERVAGPERPEVDLHDLLPGLRHAVLPLEAVGALRNLSGLGRGNLDHGPGLEVRGFQSAVERAELRLGDPEAARERIERLARMDDVVGRAFLGHAVQRLPVLLPLLLRAGLVLRADLFPADQDAFAEAHVQRVEVRIVLQKGFHRNLVLPRNGVERLALRHEMEVEGLAQLLVRLGFGNVGHEGDLDVLGGF